MEGAKFWFMIRENKRLEEPGRVRQVPFRRTAIGHRLQPVILNLQRFAQMLGYATDLAIPSRESVKVSGGPFSVGHRILRSRTRSGNFTQKMLAKVMPSDGRIEPGFATNVEQSAESTPRAVHFGCGTCSNAQ